MGAPLFFFFAYFLFCLTKMIKKLALAADLGPEPDTVTLLVRGGATFSEIQVEMHDRITGESYLNFANSVNYMMRMFVSILILQWFRKG